MEIADIENALQRRLPGKKAQYLMAPEHRPDYELADVMKFKPRIGGVLLLLDTSEEEINIIFTLRKKYDGTHSGQMSFPGGKQEAGDKDLSATALRETQEEIGIAPEHIRIIGKLSELYIPPSNFLVYPSVGVIEKQMDLIKHEYEVEEIVKIPLAFFMDEKNRSRTIIKIAAQAEVQVPAYLYGNYTIWGATAIMMSEFVYAISSL